MINESANKAMEATATKQQFFFAGETKYKPVNIEAESLEQATAEYQKVKEPAEQPQTDTEETK